MIKREKLFDWIERFNQGRLEGRELKEFMALVERNPRLRAEVKMDKELNDFLADKDVLEFRKIILKVKDEEKNCHPGNLSIYFLAASFFLLISILFYFFFHDGSACLENKKDVIVDPHHSTTKEIPAQGNDIEQKTSFKAGKGKETIRRTNPPEGKTLLADRFLPDPAFEGLVGMTARSGWFRWISPANSACYDSSQRIVFQWTRACRKDLSLEILNNKGRFQLERDPIAADTLSLRADLLGTGLFYFKFLQEDEIIYFGKFTIR